MAESVGAAFRSIDLRGLAEQFTGFATGIAGVVALFNAPAILGFAATLGAIAIKAALVTAAFLTLAGAIDIVIKNVERLDVLKDVVFNAFFSIIDRLGRGFKGLGLIILQAIEAPLEAIAGTFADVGDVASSALKTVRDAQMSLADSIDESNKAIENTEQQLKKSFGQLDTGFLGKIFEEGTKFVNTFNASLKGTEVQAMKTADAVEQIAPIATSAASAPAAASTATAPAETKKQNDTLSKSISQVASIAGSIVGGIIDFGKFILDIPEMFLSFIDNFDKVVLKFVEKIGPALQKVFEKLPEIVQSLIEGGKVIVGVLVDALPKIATSIVEQLPVIIREFGKLVPVLIDAIGEAILILLDGLPEIFDALLETLPAVIFKLLSNLGDIIAKIIGDTLPELFITLLDNLGPIVEALVAGILNALPKITIAFVKLFVVQAPKIAIAMAKAFINIIAGFFKGLFGGGNFKVDVPKSITDLPKTLKKEADNFAKQVAKSGEQLFAVKDLTDAAGAIGDADTPIGKIEAAVDFAVEKMTGLWEGFIQGLRDAWLWIKENLWDPFIDGIMFVWNWVNDNILQPLINGIMTVFQWVIDGLTTVFNWLSDNIITPLINGIRSGWLWVKENILDKLRGFVVGAWDWVKRNIVDKLKNLNVGSIFKPLTDAVKKIFGVPGWLKTLKELINKFANLNPFGGGGGGGGIGGSGITATDVATGGLNRVASAVGISFNKGGIVEAAHMQLGGFLFEPKGVDVVPAMLQPGEFVVSKPGVQAAGVPALQAINSGNPVGAGGSVMNFNVTINARTSLDPEMIRAEVVPEIVDSLQRKSQDGEFIIDARGIRGTQDG